MKKYLLIVLFVGVNHGETKSKKYIYQSQNE